MEDTTTSIIGIIVSAVIFFLVPFVVLADINDSIAELSVKTTTSEFVENVIKEGKITEEDYDNFIMALGATGNTYDIDLEIKILDDNPSKRLTINSTPPGQLGMNLYYSIYTSQVENIIYNDKKIILKEGDVISVRAKNNSKTLSQSLKNVYHTIKGDDLPIIVATGSGTIAVNGI